MGNMFEFGIMQRIKSKYLRSWRKKIALTVYKNGLISGLDTEFDISFDAKIDDKVFKAN